jgi:hypothetical protein
MTKIFSNRYFQVGAVTFGIATAFFVYQTVTPSEAETATSSAMISEASISVTTPTTVNAALVVASSDNTVMENGTDNTTEVINNTPETNKINIADEEITITSE